MRNLKLLGYLAVFLTPLIGVPAHADAIIDFESLITSGIGSTNHGSSYTEKGYEFFTTDSFASWHTDDSAFAGSTALFNTDTASGGTTTLAKVGGQAFNLHSIDVAELFRSPSSPYDFAVTFTGTKSDSSMVSQTFHLDRVNDFSDTGISGFETFAFTGFNNLVFVSWDQGSALAPHQFDNVRVSEVPEPAFYQMSALLGLGAVGLLRSRRRKA